MYDPWAELQQKAVTSTLSQVTGFGSIFKILQRIGLYGAIVTIVIFLGMYAFKWGDQRLSSDYKQRIIWKFVVIFLICSATYFTTLIMEIAQSIA